jgi:hypothetical protein
VLTLHEATRAAPASVSPSAPLGAPTPARGPFDALARGWRLTPAPKGCSTLPLLQRLCPSLPSSSARTRGRPVRRKWREERRRFRRLRFSSAEEGRAVAWVAMQSGGVRSVSFFTSVSTPVRFVFSFFSEFRSLHLCGGQKSPNRPANGSFNVVTVKI